MNEGNFTIFYEVFSKFDADAPHFTVLQVYDFADALDPPLFYHRDEPQPIAMDLLTVSGEGVCY